MWICQDTPPFLLIVSPTPPVQSVDVYVRTQVGSVNHVTTKGKRLTIFYEYGAVARALRARGSPAKRWQTSRRRVCHCLTFAIDKVDNR